MSIQYQHIISQLTRLKTEIVHKSQIASPSRDFWVRVKVRSQVSVCGNLSVTWVQVADFSPQL